MPLVRVVFISFSRLQPLAVIFCKKELRSSAVPFRHHYYRHCHHPNRHPNRHHLLAISGCYLLQGEGAIISSSRIWICICIYCCICICISNLWLLSSARRGAAIISSSSAKLSNNRPGILLISQSVIGNHRLRHHHHHHCHHQNSLYLEAPIGL